MSNPYAALFPDPRRQHLMLVAVPIARRWLPEGVKVAREHLLRVMRGETEVVEAAITEAQREGGDDGE